MNFFNNPAFRLSLVTIAMPLAWIAFCFHSLPRNLVQCAIQDVFGLGCIPYTALILWNVALWVKYFNDGYTVPDDLDDQARKELS